MSWYRDPQLFIYSYDFVYRVTKEFGINPLVGDDVNKEQEKLSFSKHLSLVNNKESDFIAFKASFPSSGITKLINSQGWVINWDVANQRGTWSREEPNSPFWKLPGIKSAIEQALEEKVSKLEAKISSLEGEVNSKNLEKQVLDLEAENGILKAEAKRERDEKSALINGLKMEEILVGLEGLAKQAIDKRVLDLEAENATLKAEVNREREEKTSLINGLKREEMLAGLEALEKKVLNLTLKPVHCCGGAGGGSSVEGPWITGHTVPSNWVPFGDLDVQPFSKNIPLMITKATGGLKFRDDKTTNVQANRFYGGIFPIVVVDVTELTPNGEDARFDPDVWSRYNNAGNSYAARKPFPSEMSIDAHKTC